MTVFMKHLPQAEFLQKFLGILANVQGNGGAVAFAGSLADFVGVAAVRDPVHWLGEMCIRDRYMAPFRCGGKSKLRWRIL